MDYPLCFASPEQYKNWVKAARACARGSKELISGFCTDCTPEYQAQMIELNRCEHPDVQFAVDRDGFMSGYRPNGAAERKEARRLAFA